MQNLQYRAFYKAWYGHTS